MRIAVKISLLYLSILLLFILFIGMFFFGIKKHINTINLFNKQKQIEQSNNLINHQLKYDLNTVKDYTFWDEMVSFLSSNNKKWAEANILTMINSYKYDQVWVFNNEMKLVYHSFGDSVNSNYLTIPKEVLIKLNSKHYISYFENSQSHIYSIVGATIHNSTDPEHKTKPFGYLLVSRSWNNKLIKDMEQLSDAKIDFKDHQLIQNSSLSNLTTVINLSNWNHKIAYPLYFTKNYSYIDYIIKVRNSAFIVTLIFIVLIIFFFVFILSKALINPLKNISKSLASGNTQYIKKYYNHNNEYAEISLLIKDFFNQKDKLLSAINETEKANRSKSEFLAVLSKEIKKPMNGIIGMCDLLNNTSVSESQRVYIQSIQSSSNTLMSIFNDIIDYSKIESGKLTIDPVEFNLIELIENTVCMFNIKAFEKNIELIIDIEEYTPTFLIGDSLRIKQILVCLLSNAIKFTQNGEVLIKVKTTMETSLKDPNQLELSIMVSDTGVGIDTDKLDRIFDSFSKTTNVVTRQEGGIGLGLALSKQLTQLMSGSITVESEIGKGSSFFVYLPLLIANRKNNEEVLVDFKFKTALIIDENRHNSEVLTNYLSHWNISSSHINNSQSVFPFLESQSVDLVFIDMYSPNNNGLKIVNFIRNTLMLHNLPIILLFANLDLTIYQDQMNHLNINYYLIKPIKKSDLLNVLVEIDKRKTGDLLNEVNPYVSDNKAEILIVEDNFAYMVLMQEYIEDMGFKVYKATKGKEALELLMQHKIDLILMDIQLPDMDGYEIARQIRSFQDARSKLPIIAVSANPFIEDKTKIKEADFDSFIFKSFDKKKLFDEINIYLSPKKATNIEKIEQKVNNDILFNRTELLNRVDGNLDLYRLIIESFTGSFPEMSHGLSLAIRSKNYDITAFSAHAIKGLCVNIEANKVKSIAEELEFLARHKMEFDKIEVLFELLKKAYDELLEEFKKF